MRLKEGDSVNDHHMQDMKEIYDSLAMLDDRVNEKDKVINFLVSLQPSYNAVRSVLLVPITWTNVQQAVTLDKEAIMVMIELEARGQGRGGTHGAQQVEVKG